MHLTFRRARTDGGPGREVVEILRDLCVQELGGRRQADAVDAQQEALKEIGVSGETARHIFGANLESLLG